MNVLFKGSLLAMLGLCLCHQGKAQGTTTTKIDTSEVKEVKRDIPVDINLQIRSLYIWRGFKVSNAPITDVDMHYNITKDKALRVGFWGGASLNGDYKEFDYFISYAKNNYSFSIWDVNNFSDYPNAKLFSYNPVNTSHFVDVRAGYKFGDSFPLSVDWTTIILGRDTHVQSNGDLKNSYSHYVELGYRLFKEGSTELHAFVGGGFAFGMQQNFYGNRPNVVNTGITINKDLVLFKYHMPIAATAMFNPEKNYGALQLVVNVF